MELGVKRRACEILCENEGFVGGTGLDGSCRERRSLRMRSSVENPPRQDLDIHAVLKGDRFGFERYAARCEVLHGLGICQEDAKRLYRTVGCNLGAFLKIVDLNLVRTNLAKLFMDMEVRGVPLHTINVKTCAISSCEDRQWLLTTATKRVEDGTTTALLREALQHLFPNDQKLALSIMYGGGVRDVLLGDWCRAYNLTPSTWHHPAFVILHLQTSGTMFFIPANCF